jgi:hypothetical protein
LAIGNELAKAARCSVGKFSFAFAARKRTGLRRVKSDKAIYLTVRANRIAVENRNCRGGHENWKAGINRLLQK